MSGSDIAQAHTPLYAALRDAIPQRDALRRALTAATRRDEMECLPGLIDAATLDPAARREVRHRAGLLVEAIRAREAAQGVHALLRAYPLSSQEGVALMSLAEALLRVPDAATKDALIADKIGGRPWLSHVRRDAPLAANAASLALALAAWFVTKPMPSPVRTAIRFGVDAAIRRIGNVFVLGETIGEALARARIRERDGFRYSFDMLGEAAMTATDAARYQTAYADAIRAIGAGTGHQTLYERAGISIKLSALHPRYEPAQRGRVMEELLPRVTQLALLCREHGVGLNIDAEEAARLDLSLDILEALCADDRLRGWDGLGFVVQAYQPRAPTVLDVLIDLARRTRRRLMVRLVKGAYWDQEIKRAQVAGLDGFPIFTRKAFTDVSYIACARKMLSARDAIYPQFATHNAQTLATIVTLAEAAGAARDYEFQCLHGMGDPLYEAVRQMIDVPCRIYAPVGLHETLLAYLVRRLLENGANSSFVNRIADPALPVDQLIEDPAETASSLGPSEAIAAPAHLYGPARRNSAGLDLDDEQALAALAALLPRDDAPAHATPMLADGPATGPARMIRNPANHADIVGVVEDASADVADRALAFATEGHAAWAAVTPGDRAAILERASDLLEARRPDLVDLLVREAGKTVPNTVAELREAVDFLRYDAAHIQTFANDTHVPLGIVVCISPWNFPLAIFLSQVAAALASGNSVIAKPAEDTPLVAALAVATLRDAGIPASALQLLPGRGEIGARLVADARTSGVVFTGSTDVARTIQRALADRLGPTGDPIPLIAETAGQNAMIVDATALPEQVVADVLHSAFDSAGQRCSALRILCLQEDVAAPILALLEGAIRERAIGPPDRLSTDIGPVISRKARDAIDAHIAAMRAKGRRIVQGALPEACAQGTFVAPTLIEIDDIAELDREIFGPVLHVLRYPPNGRDALVARIDATGYALTFGLHSRSDATIAEVTRGIAAGNVYVNRNIVGAVVGVQPFGGHGLSGTGPKAGGPLYCRRLLAAAPHEALSAPGTPQDLPSPVGERNVYTLHPRGTVLCVAPDAADLLLQIRAALAAGNKVLISSPAGESFVASLPAEERGQVAVLHDLATDRFDAVLYAGEDADLMALARTLAARPGTIITLHRLDRSRLAAGRVSLAGLVTEQVVTTNTAAAGGSIDLLASAT